MLEINTRAECCLCHFKNNCGKVKEQCDVMSAGHRV